MCVSNPFDVGGIVASVGERDHCSKHQAIGIGDGKTTNFSFFLKGTNFSFREELS